MLPIMALLFNLIYLLICRYTVDSTSGKSIFALDVSGIDPVSLASLVSSGSLNYQIMFAVDSNGGRHLTVHYHFFGWELGYRMNIYESGPGSSCW